MLQTSIPLKWIHLQNHPHFNLMYWFFFLILITCQFQPEINEEKTFRLLQSKIIPFKPHARLIETAKAFIDHPYVAGTLEGQPEELRITFEEFDCVTFIETVLALSYTDSLTSWNDFKKSVQFIRYRRNEVQYLDRLHYFSDWLWTNQKKGLVSILKPQKEIGQNLDPVHFMSTNPQYYPPLSDPAIINGIKQVEALIPVDSMQYFPKSHYEQWKNQLKTGDVIAFVTSIDGLDVSHTAFVIFQDGNPHLIHASQINKKVEVSEETLDEYMNKKPSTMGLLIARPVFNLNRQHPNHQLPP